MGFFDNLKEKVTSTTTEVGQKAKDLADTAKLNSEISKKKSEMNSIFLELGKRYIDEHKDLAEDPYSDFIQSVMQVNNQIKELESQIAKIKSEADVRKQANQAAAASARGAATKVCPKCNANIPVDSAFCVSCGANLSETESNNPVETQEVVTASETIEADTQVSESTGPEVSNSASTDVKEEVETKTDPEN